MVNRKFFMKVISMENTECFNFFPKSIRNQFIQDLKYILSLLKRIFNQREVSGEDMGGIIDMTKLVPLQKKLKNRLDKLLKTFRCLLMLLSSIEEICEWKFSLDKASKDTEPINMDLLQGNEIDLISAQTQINIWLEEIQKFTQSRMRRICIVIKQNWLSYILTLLTGFGTGLFANYIFYLLRTK
jgi:hypothetical protein